MENGSQADDGIPPEADIVALIEHALIAVRRDQSRRRPGPWGEGPFGHGPHGHGPHGGHAAHGGQPGQPGHGQPGYGQPGYGWTPHGPWSAHPGAAEHAGDTDRSGGGASPSGARGDAESTPPDAPAGPPWRGFGPPAFGDSARPGPGRRGRDGSLGRIARVRMLEALEAADADGRHLSVSTLAEAIGVDQPRASRLVQEGVERGLVRRVPDPSDARRALIQLTTAGRSQLDELRTHRRSAVETALAGFTPEEARTFAQLFDRFVRAWPRP